MTRRRFVLPSLFQPTRPLRGATKELERQAVLFEISTHAPLAGRDGATTTPPAADLQFQPTRPLRGATAVHVYAVLEYDISTHAPLAGRDRSSARWTSRRCYFNPRAPCGARQGLCSVWATPRIFQPTRPLRGATTVQFICVILIHNISTHAPLAGRDSKSVQITMHILAITDKFQMLLHRMPPVRAFCSFLMQENHADFGCEPPK